MSRADLIEREQRLSRPAGVAALAAVALILGALILQQVVLDEGRGDAGALLEADRSGGQVLLFTVMQAVGFMLLAPALLLLFRAAHARTERVLPAMVGLAGGGPLLFGAGIILSTVGVLDVASNFADHAARLGNPTGAMGQRLADRLLEDASVRSVGQALTLAGLLAMGAGILYTCLWAMRTGLLTRFWGTLGMAVGAVTILGFIPGLLLFMVALGFQLIGVWFEPRPPAWAAGEAIPWPTAAELAEQRQRARTEAEPAEQLEPPAADEGPEGNGSPTRRKRKQRG